MDEIEHRIRQYLEQNLRISIESKDGSMYGPAYIEVKLILGGDILNVETCSIPENRSDRY